MKKFEKLKKLLEEIVKNGEVVQGNTTLMEIEKELEHKRYKNQKFFKYRYFDKKGYTVDSLEKQEIFLNTPENFNDCYDSFYKIDYSSWAVENDLEFKECIELSEKYSMDYKVNGITSENLKIKYNEMKNYHQKKLRVHCFSEVNDSILMWSHYSDNHKGICIEYDFFENEEVKIFPIIYNEKIFLANKIFSMEKTQNEKLNELLFNLPTLIKNLEWNYEKEWRLISDKKKEEVKIKSIYLGVKISSENTEKICKIAKKIGVDVYQMKMSEEKFELIVGEKSLV